MSERFEGELKKASKDYRTQSPVEHYPIQQKSEFLLQTTIGADLKRYDPLTFSSREPVESHGKP